MSWGHIIGWAIFVIVTVTVILGYLWVYGMEKV
jgi:hypothetical protein